MPRSRHCFISKIIGISLIYFYRRSARKQSLTPGNAARRFLLSQILKLMILPWGASPEYVRRGFSPHIEWFSSLHTFDIWVGYSGLTWLIFQISIKRNKCYGQIRRERGRLAEVFRRFWHFQEVPCRFYRVFDDLIACRLPQGAISAGIQRAYFAATSLLSTNCRAAWPLIFPGSRFLLIFAETW